MAIDELSFYEGYIRFELTASNWLFCISGTNPSSFRTDVYATLLRFHSMYILLFYKRGVYGISGWVCIRAGQAVYRRQVHGTFFFFFLNTLSLCFPHLGGVYGKRVHDHFMRCWVTQSTTLSLGIWNIARGGSLVMGVAVSGTC